MHPLVDYIFGHKTVQLVNYLQIQHHSLNRYDRNHSKSGIKSFCQTDSRQKQSSLVLDPNIAIRNVNFSTDQVKLRVTSERGTIVDMF